MTTPGEGSSSIKSLVQNASHAACNIMRGRDPMAWSSCRVRPSTACSTTMSLQSVAHASLEPQQSSGCHSDKHDGNYMGRVCQPTRAHNPEFECNCGRPPETCLSLSLFLSLSAYLSLCLCLSLSASLMQKEFPTPTKVEFFQLRSLSTASLS